MCAKLGTANVVESNGSGPSAHALKVGHQTDGAAAGGLFAAIANTDHGVIPGMQIAGILMMGRRATPVNFTG